MKLTVPQLSISVEGFTLRPGLRARAEAGIGKLRREHSPGLGDVCLQLKQEVPPAGPPRFTACAIVESSGLDYLAHGAGPEPEFALDVVFAQLSRSIITTAGRRKSRRARPPAVAVGSLAAFP